MKEINIRDIKISAPELISDGWGLVTVGTSEKFNTMTVSWGALGEIWGKDAAFIFIRPQRYTYEFIEQEVVFTISFFAPEYKDKLRICGTKSGRDIDKAAECGFTPAFVDGTVTFEEAEYTLVCRKMASQFLDPAGFVDASIENNYAQKDYHKMYIGEILKVYSK